MPSTSRTSRTEPLKAKARDRIDKSVVTVPSALEADFVALLAFVGSDASGSVELRRGRQHIALPDVLVRVLLEIADKAIHGHDLTVVLQTNADEFDLSSQEAADILNVSRPHIVKLARTGVLPHRTVGNRHRFRRADIQLYADSQRHDRDQLLASIAPASGYTSEDF